MAVEFLEESAPSAPSVPSSGGFEFVDNPPSPAGGFEFIDGGESSNAAGAAVKGGSAAPIDDVRKRLADPNYEPTFAEFRAYQKAEQAKPFWKPGEWFETASNAMQGLWETGKKAVGGLGDLFGEKHDAVTTVAEGIARGTKRDAELLGKIVLPDLDQSKEAIWMVDRFDKFRTDNGRSPTSQERQSIRQDYEDNILPQSQFKAFLENRKALLREIALGQGKENVLGGDPSKAGVQPEVAEGVSLVLSPLALIPFGKAFSPGKSLARTAAAKALSAGGKVTEMAGEKLGTAATIPERAAGAAVRMASGSEEAATKATEQVASGVAGVSTLPLKAAAKTTEGVGEAAGAVGRNIDQGPSRFGLLQRISLDAKSPEWVRRAANASRVLDPAISLAGVTAKGAAEGATVGGVLGGLADGEQGAAAGVGSGVVLGSAGALAGRLAAGNKYRSALEDADVARWLGNKSENEIKSISALGLTREQAVKMADLERLAQGVTAPGESGDIAFKYVTDGEFQQLFGNTGKGAQIVEGEKPVVFVNTGFKGPKTLFHEVSHALDALDGFSPQRQQLNRILFDQTASDGTVLTKGLYTAQDIGNFARQYRNRLSESARAEFDLLPPEAKQSRIMSEVRADSFENLLSGKSSLAPGGIGSIRQRVADALLTADHVSFLGKLRNGLESLGVKFGASGNPSELFVKDGKPITNTPEVDAALRDYLRAKQNITKRLTASDGEEARIVVRPQDLLSKGNQGLISVFKDNDIIKKKPDGTPEMLAGVPVLLSESEIKSLQSKRVDAMVSALKAAPDLGDANAVRMKTNEAWEGKYFTDKQLDALRALPDDILSSSMKEKLVALNDIARSGDGSQIILDYNAALRDRRYSSGISMTTRAAVPLSFHISKAGNFYMNTLDVSHFARKLGEWRKSKPKAFELWAGDINAFMRDVFKYLDNHANGRPGAINLDTDAAAAVHKRNTINDFFNIPKGKGNEDLNPVQLNTRGDKDNLIRSRRFDRINRVTPGAGDKFPVKYELQKVNFLPDENALKISKVQDELRRWMKGQPGIGRLDAAAKREWLSEFGVPSHETNRKLRYTYHLSDGRVVSADSALKATNPEAYERIKTRYENLNAEKARAAVYRELPAEIKKQILDDIPVVELSDAGTNYHDAINKYLKEEGHILAGIWGQVAPELGHRVYRSYELKRIAKASGPDKMQANQQYYSRGYKNADNSAFWETPTGEIVRLNMGGGDKEIAANLNWKQISETANPQPVYQGAKFLPADVSPAAVMKQARNQAVHDLTQQAQLPEGIRPILEHYYDQLSNRLGSHIGGPAVDRAQKTANIIAKTSPQELNSIEMALTSGGVNGARKHVEQLAKMKSILGKLDAVKTTGESATAPASLK